MSGKTEPACCATLAAPEGRDCEVCIENWEMEERETMSEKTIADKVAEITAFAESVTDPVFRQSLVLIAEAMALATEFKRMDMAFLQMRGDAGLPKFALLPYDAYTMGYQCQVEHPKGFAWPVMSAMDAPGTYRFGEFFARGNFFSTMTALPKSVVPESVAAHVAGVRDKFDELLVAWEADWQPVKGDPIVIGRRGGYFYLVDSWDLSKLESFVVGAFTG